MNFNIPKYGIFYKGKVWVVQYLTMELKVLH